MEEVNQYIWSPRYVDSPMVCLHDGNADGDVSDNYSTDWRRYYLTDANHNVTTTLRIDNYNEIVWTGNDGVSRNVYTPYGEVTRCLEDWTPGGSTEELFDGPMFAGYFLDTDTGLYQVRNRFYDANLSAFLNRDPIGYAGGNNLYQYANGNPVGHADPSGLFGGRIWDAIKRVDQFGGQVGTYVWTGHWVDPEIVSCVGMNWEGTKGLGRGAVNIGVGLKNIGKEMGLQAYDVGTGVVETGGRLVGFDWRFESYSGLGQAALQSEFSYTCHAAETGANVLTVGTYGQGKTLYLLSTDQITVDEASQSIGGTIKGNSLVSEPLLRPPH